MALSLIDEQMSLLQITSREYDVNDRPSSGEQVAERRRIDSVQLRFFLKPKKPESGNVMYFRFSNLSSQNFYFFQVKICKFI